MGMSVTAREGVWQRLCSQEELEELFMDIGDQLEDDLNDIMYELYFTYGF